MKVLSKVLAFGVLTFVAACTGTNPGGWGSGAGGAGAAGAAGDPTSPAYFQQAVGDRVFFAVNESTLSAEAQQVLRSQAEWLNQNPDYRVTVEGHADEQGTREYNLALGARRANAAREFLVQSGVAAERLQTVSYGKERPVEICSSESCYSKNRRAVTVLAGGLTG